MTLTEFSSEFDILYNNIMSNAAPGLDEYEKSVFLTQAQEQLVVEVYNGSYNSSPFEDTEESRIYLSNLISSVNRITTSSAPNHPALIPNKSFFATLPDDYLFRIQESVTFSDDNYPECLTSNGVLTYIKPVTHDEVIPIMRNPFRGPDERRVLRLDISDNYVELISNYNVSNYILRYLKKPNPIILVDLTTYNISINGVTTETNCELHTIFHRPILERAVELARQAWVTGS